MKTQVKHLYEYLQILTTSNFLECSIQLPSGTQEKRFPSLDEWDTYSKKTLTYFKFKDIKTGAILMLTSDYKLVEI